MADEKRRQRALKHLDYRLTGDEAVIAIDVMASFASIEVAAKLREVAGELAEIHDHLDYEYGRLSRYIDKLTAEADALEGE